jgi:organic radical activating enzyme
MMAQAPPSRRPRKSAAILLNDRCPLKCAHCSIGYSASYSGTSAVVGESELIELIDALVSDGFDTIAFAGGEPAITPRLLRTGLKAAHERSVRSVLITAPVWAKSLAIAERFVSSLPHLDTVALSFDRPHLKFLTLDHYTNAVTAVQGAEAVVAFNICYSTEAERIDLAASLQRLYPTMQTLPKNLGGVAPPADMSWKRARELMRARGSRGPFINFERILPVGNAASLPDVYSEATRLETLDDFDRITRSCNIGNVIVDTKTDLHACCWSPVIPGSPLRFERAPGTTFASLLSSLDRDQRISELKHNGLIGSLSQDEKARLLESLRGKLVVNECHLCLSALARAEPPPVEALA